MVLLQIEFNCLTATEALQGDSLHLSTKSSEVHGTHMINLEKLKGWVDLWPPTGYWAYAPWMGNPEP